MMRHKWAIILVLLLLAFGLRLYHLTSVPLSLDEIVTIRRYARLPVTEIFQTYHSNNHPLISALAHIFSPQADNLFMLRWPSILVGLIALPFIYRLGASLFDRRVGLLALFFVSLTPVYIGYSVIMRGYGGLISFTAIALYFLGQALRRNRWRDWLGLAAVGMVSVNEALSAWGCRRERSRQIAVRVLQGGVLAGLLVLQLNSLHWYLERATHADWWGLAQALSAELSPQDMLVCEEYQRGFDLPDRAKPYCTWMLGFFLKREEYTSLFPSSTDFVTGYDHLQAERESLLKPGRVWLVIWQKIPFNVEHLITTEAPVMAPPPPPDTLAPYFTRPYGSAILVRVDSEPTLLGNLYRAVEVLLKADPAPVAQARYYRSLAEMTALQGQVGRARELLAKSQTLVSQNGGSVDSFLAHTQQVIDRIPADSSPPPTAYPVGYKFGSALCLLAYEVLPLTPTAGQPLNLNFYWRALEPVKQDYNFFLDLEANQRNRLEFEPFDRTFPTPWWWSGQQVVENRSFNLPLDLPGQDYTVNFGVHDRQGQAVEEVAPLFKMQYQPDDGGLSRWKIKSITGPAVCP